MWFKFRESIFIVRGKKTSPFFFLEAALALLVHVPRVGLPWARVAAAVRRGPTFLSSLVLASLWVPPGVAVAVAVILSRSARPGCREDGMEGGTRAVGRCLSRWALCCSAAPLLYL